MDLPARDIKDIAARNARPGGTGQALATIVALLTVRRDSRTPLVSRATLLADCDIRRITELLEVIAAGMMSALPDNGQDILQTLGLLAATWEAGTE
jgi:hypothetical protein